MRRWMVARRLRGNDASSLNASSESDELHQDVVRQARDQVMLAFAFLHRGIYCAVAQEIVAGDQARACSGSAVGEVE